MNLVVAIPTEQVIFSDAKTLFLINSAIFRPLPNSFLDPVTSRKASSRESGST